MEIVPVDFSNHKQVRAFLELPGRIYRELPLWVPPLEMDMRRLLDPRRHPFYRHSAAAFFLASDHGRTVGRIAAIDRSRQNEADFSQSAFFYLFECEPSPQAAQALFQAAADWARGRGLRYLVGPKGFTPLQGAGLLVEGFDEPPAFGMPYNPGYYPDLIESAGFRPHRDTISGVMTRATANFPPRIHVLAARVAERRGLRVRVYRNRRDLRDFIRHIHFLYNESIGGTRDNAYIDGEDVRAMSAQLLWFADPALVKLVMKGERPVGFVMAYPDVSAGIRKAKGRLLPFGWMALLRELQRTERINLSAIGLVEEVRGMGGTAILFSEMEKSLTSNPRYQSADVIAIDVTNQESLREMSNLGIIFDKRHRTYLLDL